VGLERGALGLASTIDELLERKNSGSGLGNREYGRRDPSRWPRGILYPQKLAVTSLAIGGRSVGIVRSRTQATEFSLVLVFTSQHIQKFRNITLIYTAYCHYAVEIGKPLNVSIVVSTY
jgi:hypothetical protein